MASIYAQTLCEIVGLDILKQAARHSAEGYSVDPITGYEPEGVFVATIQLDIAGPLPLRPGAQPGPRLHGRDRERPVLR